MDSSRVTIISLSSTESILILLRPASIQMGSMIDLTSDRLAHDRA